VFDKLGFFDSVRFAADSEFKHRMETYFGSDKVIRTKDIVYWAKIRPESLTRCDKTGIYTEGRSIRKQYVADYTKWHTECLGDKENLYVGYPIDEVDKRKVLVPAIMLP